MRVLFVTTSKETHEGSSKALLQILGGLLEKGVTPMVILPEKKSLYLELQNRGIYCDVLPRSFRMSVLPNTKTRKDKLLFIPRLIGRCIINSLATTDLLKVAKHFSPDLIHTNVSVTPIGYYVARLLKLPHVWHIREYGALDLNTFYYYPSFGVQKKRYKRKRSYTIGITKDILRYNNLTTHHNSTVIYDGVLPANATNYRQEKQPYFLFAGRLEKIKGILPLIDAYAEYTQRHPSPIPLYIAGSGTTSYEHLVKEKIKHHGLEKQILLLGMRNDILELYQEAKALIVSSLSEGFGFITAEAMFSGCLVIGHDVAGTKEQFDNGKEMTGEEIALRYTTQEELVQHLINATNYPIEHFEPMILSAQQVVCKLYTAEKNSEHIYNLYTSILNQKSHD